MKFVIKNSGGSILTLLRKVGYSALMEAYIRPLGRNGYPRFHIYIKKGENDLVLDLHLDQKKPVYKGATAHSGEYDSPIVEQEAERIKQILEQNGQ